MDIARLIAPVLACTTQTAVTLSLAMGRQRSKTIGADARRADRSQPLRGHAANNFYAALRARQLFLHVTHSGEPDTQHVEYRSTYGQWAKDRSLEPPIGFHANAAVACLDGAGALNDGRDGSVSSVLLYEGPAAFAGPGVDRHMSYLVLVVGPAALRLDRTADKKKQTLANSLDEWTNKNREVRSAAATPLDKWFAKNNGLTALLSEHGAAGGVDPVVATAFEADSVAGWKPALGIGLRTRTLEGSAVIAGLAPLLGHVSAALFTARPCQTLQVAAAARCLGGRCWAIPFRGAKTGESAVKKGRAVVDNSEIILTEQDIAPSGRVALCVTSCSEVCLMDRVRRDGSEITSHSIVIDEGGILRVASSLNADTASFFAQQVKRKERGFHANDPESRVARQHLDAFRNVLVKRKPS